MHFIYDRVDCNGDNEPGLFSDEAMSSPYHFHLKATLGSCGKGSVAKETLTFTDALLLPSLDCRRLLT
ncbi:hypothetical protein TNCV_834171 [Trichonephila clavipes]|nr:hypothetical protein TNCV_834171 [Trichonephila clavipes]